MEEIADIDDVAGFVVDVDVVDVDVVDIDVVDIDDYIYTDDVNIVELLKEYLFYLDDNRALN